MDAAARAVIISGVLVVISLALYSGRRDQPYVYEDQETVDESLARGAALVAAPFANHDGLSLDASRLSLWAPAQLFGNTPVVHRNTNLALHLFTGLMVAACLSALGASTIGWALGAALFLTHGIQTEAVALVASRSEILMSAFLVSALWYAAVSRLTWMRAVGVFLLGVLAMASKQEGVLLILLLPLVLWHRPEGRRQILAIGAAWVALVAVSAFWIATRGEAMALPFYGLNYVGYQLAAFWNLVSLTVVPWGRLNIDHDIGWLPTWVAHICLGLSVAVVIIAGHLWRETPLIGTAILWPFVVMIPRLALRLPEWVNEHQWYLPMIGISLGVAMLITRCEHHFSDEECEVLEKGLRRAARRAHDEDARARDQVDYGY